MEDIEEYKKEFNNNCNNALNFLKEEKLKESIDFYKKAIECLESLIKYDENKHNRPVYEDKKKKLKKKLKN